MVRCLLLIAMALASFCQAQPIEVVSFNIRYGTADDGAHAWAKRRTALFAQIRTLAPDVLGVQEALAFQLDELAAVLPHHVRIGQGRRGGDLDEHCAIFVDARKLAVIAEGDFWLSTSPDAVGTKSWDSSLPRIATWARLRMGTTEWVVLNTHWDHRGSVARTESARLIAERLQRIARGAPALILGDFNTGAQTEPLRVLEQAGYVDTWRKAIGSAPDRPEGTFHGFTGELGRDKIDFILANDGFVVDTASHAPARHAGVLTSDHLAVTARVRLREAP